MNSAIIINLDYEQYGSAVCCRVWKEIETRMLRAGFVKNNRLFLTKLAKDDACEQAKAIVAIVGELFAPEKIQVIDLIREFYGLDYQNIHDLLTPANEAIEVDFLDTGTFQAYFNKP